MRPVALAAFLALTVGCVHQRHLRPVPPDGGGWRELRTEHFVLETDLPLERARALGAELEAILDGLARALFHAPPKLVSDARVVAFSSDEELEVFLPYQANGIATRSWQLGVVIPGDIGEQQRAIVAHELTHVLAADGLSRQPAWFAEGVASYAETIGWTGPRKNVTLGRVPPWRAPTGRPQDMPGLLTAKELSPYGYSSAWALVHFLMNRRGAAFAELQDRFERGEEPMAAWRAVFPEWNPDVPGAMVKLEDALWRYLVGNVSAYVYRPERPPAAAPRCERLLSPAEVHDIRLRLRWHNRGERVPKELFDAELAEALTAGSVEAAIIQTRRTPDEAVAIAERFTGEHPSSAKGWLLLAQAADKDPARSEAALRRAVEIDPANALARSLLARRLLDDGRARDAVPHANEAVRLAPWQPLALDTLAAVAEAVGRCEDALAAARQAIHSTREVLDEDGRKPLVARLDRLEKSCGPAARPAPGP